MGAAWLPSTQEEPSRTRRLSTPFPILVPPRSIGRWVSARTSQQRSFRRTNQSRRAAAAALPFPVRRRVANRPRCLRQEITCARGLGNIAEVRRRARTRTTSLRSVGREAAQLSVQAVRADAVRRLRAQRAGDPMLTVTDRLEAEPLAADLQGIAPGAAEKQYMVGSRLAQCLRKLRKLARVALKSVGLLMRLDRPSHQVVVERQCFCSSLRAPSGRRSAPPSRLHRRWET